MRYITYVDFPDAVYDMKILASSTRVAHRNKIINRKPAIEIVQF